MADFALRGSIELDAGRFVSGARTAARAGQDLTSDLERGAKDAEQAIDRMGDATGDFAGAARQAGSTARADMAETAAIADRLAQAIGPSLEAAIGRSGIDRMAGELDRAGMSARDVEDAAADLRAELGQVASEAAATGDKARAGFDQVGDAARRAGTETENTRSVVANFAGNAVQELPGVGAAFGPLNMAVGQFAEYATEGNIQFRKLLAGGALVGAAVGAIAALNAQLDRMGKTDAWRDDEVSAYVDAMRDGATVAEAMAEQIRRTGEVVYAFGSGFKGDLIPVLANAGVTMDQFVNAANGGQEGLDRLSRALEAGRVSGDSFNLIMGAATEYARNAATATERYAATQAVLGDETDEATGATTGLRDTLAGMIPTVSDLDGASRGFADALAVQRQKEDEAAEAAREHRIAIYDLQWQYDELRGELSDRSTYLDVEDSFADIQRAAEEAYVAAAAGAADAGQKARDLERATLDGRQAVIDYAEATGGVPREILTKILAEVDQGSYDRAMWLLRNLEQNRTMSLSIEARGGTGYWGTNRASGGPAPMGRTGWTGEHGPELVTWGSPAYVTPTHAVTSALYTLGTTPAPQSAAPVVVQTGIMPGDSFVLMVDGAPVRAVVRSTLAETAATMSQGVRR